MRANGSTNGHRATLKIDTEKKYGYALVSNLASGATELILMNLEAILEGREPELPAVAHPAFIQVPEAILAEYAGQYQRIGGGGSMTVALKGNVLSAADISLYPIKPDCFFEYKWFGEVCFGRDAAGGIRSVSWIGPGFKLEWERR